MFKSKQLNLNGLKLSGDKPISPRTNAFLIKHNMKVKQENGYVSLTGSFSLDSDTVKEFNDDKDNYIKKHNLKLK